MPSESTEHKWGFADMGYDVNVIRDVVKTIWCIQCQESEETTAVGLKKSLYIVINKVELTVLRKPKEKIKPLLDIKKEEFLHESEWFPYFAEIFAQLTEEDDSVTSHNYAVRGNILDTKKVVFFG
ncbi:unnamed protein product [Lepeophtheirus salmonis]|uniref:(salmon louse) hypothetical protein n=1 Tax=Lepeophtheirus salmonis TaxID=72036 RepID=A0A7R8CWQ5_LEPSM|nr:unnamed protein product [Lepeophtheirus salmonis]CAF2953955.1 unnamed protein product [Lepeophtheirus salmonis]